MSTVAAADSKTLFGHPAGLFTLFFAEMWERFSYYGMRALLVLYMIKGFLQYGDSDAYAVYGAYTALVYMTPFFGGMLADRLLGARRAVIFGGLLMALGQFFLMVPDTIVYFGGPELSIGPRTIAFYSGLSLLICGNGFFKPNISTIVGSLYPLGSARRDGGFTIFYMGINLGAAMSPLLCGFIGETFGWHWGFGLATVGMLTGLVVFVAPRIVTAVIIMSGALGAAGLLLYFRPDNPFSISVNVFVALALVSAGIVAVYALGRGGLPAQAGAPPDPARLRHRLGGALPAEWAVYLGTLVAIPVFVLLVSGFAPLTEHNRSVTIVPDSVVDRLQASESPLVQIASVVVKESSRPAGLVLLVCGVIAFGYLIVETFRLDRIPRHRMYVVLILTFFSMLFWAFFEQAGSSLNNFTDRNVDRVFEVDHITAQQVGQTIKLQPTQEQLGRENGGKLFTLDALDALRKEHKDNPEFEIDWTVSAGNVGMGIAKRTQDIPASTFQAVNAVYIIVFGLVFTAIWSFLARREMEPSTPVKFAMGLLQLGLGFAVFWYGAKHADERGMVALGWLFLGYLLHTTGELCLSPVGLSMVTKLSPARLVSTVMGAWFLATAFSQFLAAIIAQFTGVSEGADGGGTVIPIPSETVHVYGGVFGKIALAALISALICFALSPLLSRWMHAEVVEHHDA
jgi:POT family proton-dependent oligopeptide transporter